MKIALHAGNCCGIKTIANICEPDQIMRDKEEGDKKCLSYDRSGRDFPSDFNFFWEKAPEETYLERFDRYIAYLERVRRYGLVEVVLAVKTDCSCAQIHGETMNLLESGKIQTFEEAIEYANNNYDLVWDESDYQEGGRETNSLQDDWIPLLIERGFREVSRFPNINSGNEVAVFHLVMNGEYYKNKKAKENK